MAEYTSGELAKQCNITVRTVQFYDKKNLLKPSKLTEGGRRLYSEDDLSKLRLICLLKTLGLSLDSIKGVLESDNSNQILLLLLDKQIKIIGDDIKDKQKQLETINLIKQNIKNNDQIDIYSIYNIENIVQSKKILKKTHLIMLIIGIIIDIIWIYTIILWITKGIWIPFVIGAIINVIFVIVAVRIYYLHTMYQCPNCNTIFRPPLKEFIFSKHTPKTRKLTCPNCGYNGYCVEIGVDTK